MTVAEAAELVGGELIGGDPGAGITGVASAKQARSGDLTFFANPRYLGAVRSTKAAAVIVPKDFADEIPAARIRVDNPSSAFAQIVARFAPPPVEFSPGVHATAVVGEGAVLGEGVSVQPFAVIERGARIGARSVIGAHSYIGHETVLGEDCLLYSRVTIRERCTLGNRVILQPGVVIGADGFGYEFQNGRHEKIPQTGTVEIEDDVEIGANTTIDRARFGRTWIGAGTKIDNLVMVAHNNLIGPHAILCAQVGISGSTSVGAYATLAGQVGVNGHVEIGEQVIVAAQGGVTKSLSAKGVYMGAPAEPVDVFKKRVVQLRRMERYGEKLKELEARLDQQSQGPA